LQIDTDLLRIITSTADELSGGTNSDNIERPGTLKRRFSVFFAILGCDTHFNSELRRNHWDRPRQPAYGIFSIKHRF